jgi:IclR family transcriptional regulator, KDG regulon repressor
MRKFFLRDQKLTSLGHFIDIALKRLPGHVVSGVRPALAMDRWRLALSVTVRRVLKCLQVVGEAQEGITAPDVAQRLSISRSSAVRLLEALRRDDVVRRYDSSRKYHLGLGLYSLGGGTVARVTDILVARNEMVRLVAATQRPIQYVVLHGNQILVIERVDWVDGSVVCAPTHAKSPWHLTAVGKVLVAFAPESISHGAARAMGSDGRGPRTLIVDELEMIRRQGYAEARETLRPGFFAISVPILDYRGYATAALGMSTTEEELSPQHLHSVLTPLKACGERISYQLGYRQMDLPVAT